MPYYYGPDGRCFLAAWAVSKSVHCCLNQGLANFSRRGPDLDFFDLPWPKREKKSLHFKSISDFAIFSPKIVMISKEKVFTSI